MFVFWSYCRLEVGDFSILIHSEFSLAAIDSLNLGIFGLACCDARDKRDRVIKMLRLISTADWMQELCKLQSELKKLGVAAFEVKVPSPWTDPEFSRMETKWIAKARNWFNQQRKCRKICRGGGGDYTAANIKEILSARTGRAQELAWGGEAEGVTPELLEAIAGRIRTRTTYTRNLMRIKDIRLWLKTAHEDNFWIGDWHFYFLQ